MFDETEHFHNFEHMMAAIYFGAGVIVLVVYGFVKLSEWLQKKEGIELIEYDPPPPHHNAIHEEES
jgi:hypothetical protein